MALSVNSYCHETFFIKATLKAACWKSIIISNILTHMGEKWNSTNLGHFYIISLTSSGEIYIIHVYIN